jgi:hypothetical protein
MQDVSTEMMLVLLGFAVVLAWLVSLFVYILLHRISSRTMDALVGDFQKRFPRQCFICSYYRNVMFRPPPEHNCNHWTAEL